MTNQDIIIAILIWLIIMTSLSIALGVPLKYSFMVMGLFLGYMSINQDRNIFKNMW